ncbi:hypothetical protein C6503_24680 [Candidatus Poribacteria bacterium]|nr:MAG: hypothetical protein C6503_24680 [Candidatus Poribacteria bacterium]
MKTVKFYTIFRHPNLSQICFALLLAYCFPLAAQVNIFTGETVRQMQLEAGWYNSINLDLTYRTGNTDLLTSRTRFRSDYLSKTYHGFIFGSLQQGRKSGAFFINQGMAHARIIRNLTQHVLFESFVQKQFNESILLSDRNLVGGGIRFDLHPSNFKFNIYLGIGAMSEHERINDKDGGEITTRIIRSTNYINWTGQLDERITTSATGYYQVNTQRLRDYRVLFEGSLTFRLTTKLAFPLRVNFRYDNEPPTGIRKHDVEIFNGLGYTF